IETYLSINTNSIIFDTINNGKLQSSVEVLLVFKDKEKGEIKDYLKYELKSKELDSIQQRSYFIYDQQRVTLKNGIYQLEIKIKDQNNEDPPIESIIDLDVNNGINDEFSISSIELLRKIEKTKEETVISKGGYDLYPRLSKFYVDSDSIVMFYAEIYSAKDKSDTYLLKYNIVDSDGVETDLGKIEKVEIKNIYPKIEKLNIQSLSTGKYSIIIQLIDKNNNTLAKKSIDIDVFKNLNQYASIPDPKASESDLKVAREKLIDYTESLFAISDNAERIYLNNVLKTDKTRNILSFFYTFWEKRNPNEPLEEWKKYYEKVQLADKRYSIFKRRGALTDRGLVLLKYGVPDHSYDGADDMKANPYEIWHYNKWRNISNLKFVFCSNDYLADYELLHSNVKGEVRNIDWVRILYKETFVEIISQSENPELTSRSFDSENTMNLINKSFIASEFKALLYYKNPQ
ncbi:MAG: GWxTD domain-containing protein, partial [Hyphomicrobiales bacterium]